MYFVHTLGFVAFVISAAASSLSPRHVLHEKREEHHHGWVKRSSIPRGKVFPMRIGLAQSNLHRAEELLMEVSHPSSPKYGQHYTADEVVDMFAPAAHAVESVKAWLLQSGIKNVGLSANKQWLQFEANVEHAEELFKTNYFAYEHEDSGKIHVGCDEYHMPEHIREHVDYVLPGLRLIPGKETLKTKIRKRERADAMGLPGPIIGKLLPNSVKNLSKKEQLAKCDSIIFPPCVAALYNISQATKARADNHMGIFEEGDYYGKEDLIEFFSAFAENIPPTTEPILHSVDGGRDLSVATGESDLDFQISYPIIYPQTSILFQTDDINYALLNFSTGDGIFNTFLDAIDGSYCNFTAYGETGDSSIDPKYPDPAPEGYKGPLMCGKYKPTNVISFSYGLAEASMPTNYMRRQCLEYLKLGMQGSTLLFASQDAGVAARYQVSNNKDDCLAPNGTVFAPDFPANCPWVLAVGSTALTNGTAGQGKEHATDQFGSGAGFSNVYHRPKYQEAAVNTYLTQHEPSLTGYKSYALKGHVANPKPHLTKGGRFNSAGRGYPDVSAIGENIIIILDGAPVTVGGTSAATPVWAAIINRINEERLDKGKKTLGFINPILYENPQLMHDITSGNSPGCNTNGFYTAPGWDPSTGLGTPDFPKLLKFFLALK